MLAVTGHRLRARPGRALLVSAGVTVAVAFLVGVAGGSAVSEDLALRHALSSLPSAERALRIAWSGQVAHGGYAALDRTAQREVGTLTSQPLTRSLELSDVRLGTGLVKLGAVSGIGRYVHLSSGRLPRACTPARCEVVQVGGTPLRRVDESGVRLDVVGKGTLTSLVPFGAGGLATQSSAGGIRPEPVLLSSSIRGLASLPPLRLFPRSYGWTAPLDPQTAHVWDIDRLLAAEGRAEARLSAASGQFGLTAPDDALTSARTAGHTASRRVLLVGGAAAVLLLAFAGLTAGALRRDVRAELRRLGQRGATITQQGTFVLVEALSAVLPGVLAGLVLGIAAVAVIAQRAGVPVAPALSHGLATPASVALVAAGAFGALAVVVLALRRPTGSRASGVRPIDVAAIGAVVALALLLLGSSSSGGALGAGPAVTLAAVPLLASFAFAVLLGRLLEPAIRTGLRASRGAPVTLRLALLALHRSPARAAGVAGFLAISVGSRDVRALLPRHARSLECRARRLRRAARLHGDDRRGARRPARRGVARGLSRPRAGRRRLADPAPGRRCRRHARDAAHADRAGRAVEGAAARARLAQRLLTEIAGAARRSAAAANERRARRRPDSAHGHAAAAAALAWPERPSSSYWSCRRATTTPRSSACPCPPRAPQGVLGVRVPPALRGGRVVSIQVQLPSQRSALRGTSGRRGPQRRARLRRAPHASGRCRRRRRQAPSGSPISPAGAAMAE